MTMNKNGKFNCLRCINYLINKINYVKSKNINDIRHRVTYNKLARCSKE